MSLVPISHSSQELSLVGTDERASDALALLFEATTLSDQRIVTEGKKTAATFARFAT